MALVVVAAVAPAASAGPSPVHRIDHVADGDTVTLRNGQRVRLVQIDTPEVYFGVECYDRQASAVTKRLLPLPRPTSIAAAVDASPLYSTGSPGMLAPDTSGYGVGARALRTTQTGRRYAQVGAVPTPCE
jgi:hypothetical protein